MEQKTLKQRTADLLAFLAQIGPLLISIATAIRNGFLDFVEWAADGERISKEDWKEFRDVVRAFPEFMLKTSIALGVGLEAAKSYSSFKNPNLEFVTSLSGSALIGLAALWLIGIYSTQISEKVAEAYTKIKTADQIGALYEKLKSGRKTAGA